MRGRLGLCLLGLLCLHSSVYGEEVTEVQPGVLIFCDDPSVEKAVTSALNKFNGRLTTGHKLALYQITAASKTEVGSDSVYSLQFTSRRSDCLATFCNRSWTDCDYLPLHNDPISCNATVYMTESEAETREVDCVLDDHIVHKKAQCLGCPVKIYEYSDELRGPLLVSMTKYNSKSDSTHLFTLHSVDHATRQVVAGLRYKVRFDMIKTNCAKAEHPELHKLCLPDEQNAEFANCNSTVDVAPWRHEPAHAQIECVPGMLPMLFTRRRPPGWSPLRNLLFGVPATTSPPTTAAAAAPKEESSEEDTTGPKTSASPEVASAADNNPFHCPSKSWKPFNPPTAEPEAPTEEAAIEPGSTQPSDFSDADLLG